MCRPESSTCTSAIEILTANLIERGVQKSNEEEAEDWTKYWQLCTISRGMWFAVVPLNILLECSGGLLQVDPHCAYDISFKVSLSAAASRFLLVHGLQVGWMMLRSFLQESICFGSCVLWWLSLVLNSPFPTFLMSAGSFAGCRCVCWSASSFVQLAGLSVAVVLFALMRQARAWELNDPLPSIVTCIESNLRLPLTFFALGMGPILLYFSITIFGTETCPSLISFMGISIICYLFANGAVALLAYISCAVFYTTAFCHSFIRVR